MAGRPRTTWTFNYYDLSDISGKSVNAIQRSRTRPGGFDPDDLLSVVGWILRNAKPDIKAWLLAHATNVYVGDPPPTKKARKG